MFANIGKKKTGLEHDVLTVSLLLIRLGSVWKVIHREINALFPPQGLIIADLNFLLYTSLMAL